ncbi:hypothetical protein ACQP2H_01130 [Micromonospora sp. CA-248260]|uniref:hypothetical protein n=1 Tax=Micromonospora sp. CA-248260 TaxID=3239962 RepID=UPI003D9214AB
MAAVTVGVHIRPDTVLSFRSHPDQDRVVLELGESGGDVAVFLPRSEIARLAEVLAQAQESLSVPTVKAAA